MSIESFSPLPLNVFGTWVTLLDPSDVPAGMSLSLSDVEFFPGGVRTRAGPVSQFSALTGTPQINGVETYATTNLIQRFPALDSLGDLYKETMPGVLSLAASGIILNALMASATQFGREYIALSDGLMGQDLPRQYDDTNFDRVSQIGPAEGPALADTVPQIEALRKENPHLYEALTSIAQASLGPNQGWSLDNQITDGVDYSRVSSGATTAGKIDPTKTGVLMKGSVPPTWSGAFVYVSAPSTITWSCPR